MVPGTPLAQARQLRKLRELLPVGLREFDLQRLLGDGGRGALVVEREAVAAEIVCSLICGLAATRAYGEPTLGPSCAPPRGSLLPRLTLAAAFL